MKRPFLAISILVCSLALAGSGAKEHPIEVIDRQFAAAMKAGDPEAVAALYAKDCVVYLPDMEIKGKDNMKKMLVEFLGASTIKEFTFNEPTYSTSGDLSVSWGTFTMEIVPKAGGESTKFTGRFTGVAQKIDGKWLYVVDHASVPMVAPPSG